MKNRNYKYIKTSRFDEKNIELYRKNVERVVDKQDNFSFGRPYDSWSYIEKRPPATMLRSVFF